MPAQRIGRFDIAGSYGNRSRQGLFGRHIAQQGAQEAGNRRIAGTRRAGHINLKARRPQRFVGPNSRIGGTCPPQRLDSCLISRAQI